METLSPFRRDGSRLRCVSGWAGPDLSPLVVHRHTDDLSDLRRWLLRWAETEMVQDRADRDGVGDVGNDLERATAASADERIRLKDLGDEPRPAWGAAALRGLLLLVLLASQFLGGPLAAYAVGVVGIEVGAMFAGVGDVVGQTRQPFQRVHGLEIAAERGIHARAVQHGLLAFEPRDREAIPPDEARPIHSGAPDDKLLERE